MPGNPAGKNNHAEQDQAAAGHRQTGVIKTQTKPLQKVKVLI